MMVASDIALPVPPAPIVPIDELASRIARLQEEMRKEQLDFVVLTSQNNIEYLTDYRTMTWGYNARPLFAVVGGGEIFVIASNIEERNLGLRQRSFQAHFYTGYLKEGAAAVASQIRKRMAYGNIRIGIDYGQDMFGRGSLELVDELCALHSKREVASAGRAIWRTRMIKSPFEASLKRISFAIVNDAFDHAIADARIGDTEVDLCRDIQARIVKNGAERFDPITVIFRRGGFVYSVPASGRRLQAGEYVWTDFRSTYGGYAADRNRTARAGEPDSWEADVYRTTREATVELCEAVKPGMTCAELFHRFTALWKNAGLPQTYGIVSRIGHGGGLDVTEPPSIAPDDFEEIRPGMILHLEPKLEMNGAVFQFEEVIYVKEQGVEFLSALSPPHMPIVAG